MAYSAPRQGQDINLARSVRVLRSEKSVAVPHLLLAEWSIHHPLSAAATSCSSSSVRKFLERKK